MIEQAARPTTDEQLQLIAHLAEAARQPTAGVRAGRDWMEIHGAAPGWVCTQCGEPLFEAREVELMEEALTALDRRTAALSGTGESAPAA